MNALKKISRILLLTSMIAFTGCTTPMMLSHPQTAVQKGTLSLKIHWPESYQTQIIPNSTTKIVVTVKKGENSLLTDENGNPVPERCFMRGNGYESPSLSLELDQQEGIEVAAQAFREEEGDSVLLGSASKSVDVIPGFTNYVNLDIDPVYSPTLNPLTTSELKPGDQLTLTGTGFGAGTAEAVLQVIPVVQEYYFYRQPVYLPVTRKSDTELAMTIPSNLLDNYAYLLSDYFQDKENRYKLILWVRIDGVPSNLLEVSIPKSGSLQLGLSLTQGKDATASTGFAESYNLDIRQKYQMPRMVGTTWSYEIDNGSSTATRSFQVVMDSTYGLSFRTAPYSPTPYDSFVDYNLRAFTKFAGSGQLQYLGQESLTLPYSGAPVLADHYAAPYEEISAEYPYNGWIETWFVQGVGLVKLKKQYYYTGYSNYSGYYKYSYSQTVVLKQFGQENQ